MININFIKLFTIEILNKYYSDQLCDDFSITASTQTASVLSGYNIVYKQYDNRLYAGIPGDINGNATFAPDEDTQFVFFLKCNNPIFYNFTNCPAGGLQGNLLYFTNKNDNPVNGKLILSAGITPYNAATAYNAGDLALAAGIVYEAIKTNTGTPLTDLTAWMPVDSDSYVSANDVKQIHQDPLQQAADPNDLVNFIPTADYAELLNATDVCGVINIVNDSTLSNGYKLLAAGKIMSPLYSIYFLNRATKWKYILVPNSTGTIKQISPVSANPAFPTTTVLTNSFTSVFPLRINEMQPATNAFTFQLTTSGGQTINGLPLAGPETIALPENTGEPFYSDIYLNY
jgi:hypothetical protein